MWHRLLVCDLKPNGWMPGHVCTKEFGLCDPRDVVAMVTDINNGDNDSTKGWQTFVVGMDVYHQWPNGVLWHYRWFDEEVE